MRTIAVALLCLTGLLLSLPAAASTVDYTTPGTYSVSTNCGFVALTSGWIRMKLTGDASGHYTDLLVRSGDSYPLALSSVTIYPSGNGGASIRVTTTFACTCSVTLDPYALPGMCYTKALGVDYCEEDYDRPMFNDPEAVPPGPDIAFASVGFYGSAEGEVDTIGLLQSDWGYWNTARLREGEWIFGGIRRCRVVDGSALTYLTLIAP